MFIGTYDINIKENGMLDFSFDHNCRFVSALLKRQGEKCTLLYDKENTEIIFSFEGTASEGEKVLTEIGSTVVADDVEKIKKQFYIPKPYIEIFYDSEAKLLGLNNSFSVIKKSTYILNAERNKEFIDLIADIIPEI